MKTQRIETADDPKSHPAADSQWLRTPGLLLILVGAAGLLRWYVQPAEKYLSSLKFPPIWACGVLIGCGVLLVGIIAANGLKKRRLNVTSTGRPKWRTL